MGVRHEYVRRMRAMDAAYLRERAAICLRLANGLSWNNPADPSFSTLPKISIVGRETARRVRRLQLATTRTDKKVCSAAK
jgi:hypothetical protein